MKSIKDISVMHPVLIECVHRIDKDIIIPHNMPFRIFETGRTHDRHQDLLIKRRTTDILSRHLFDLEHDPPIYATAVDYVYFDGTWSWNLRNAAILNWYKLFGMLVLDKCPEVMWKGLSRYNINYTHFQLTDDCILDNYEQYPCVIPSIM